MRVHTGTQAAENAKSLNAKAFTVGNNIVFGQGQFTPNSHEGKRLIGHELTHTIQQGKTGTAAAQTKSMFVQRQSAGRDELLAAFRGALARQDWADAAVRLNGFSSEDIEMLVGNMRFGQLAHVREAAVIAMPGWSSRVTDVIDRADTPTLGGLPLTMPDTRQQ